MKNCLRRLFRTNSPRVVNPISRLLLGQDLIPLDLILIVARTVVVPEGITSACTTKRLLPQLLEVVSGACACASNVAENKLAESLQSTLRPAKPNKLVRVLLVREDLLNDFFSTDLHDF